jgi:hypothetical protein
MWKKYCKEHTSLKLEVLEVTILHQNSMSKTSFTHFPQSFPFLHFPYFPYFLYFFLLIPDLFILFILFNIIHFFFNE